MFFAVWHDWLGRRPRRQRRPGERCRPSLEELQNRTLLSTFTVIGLGDDGRGSGLQGDLRYCVNTANANPDLSNRIIFQPGLAGMVTLSQGPLAITKDLEIDGPGTPLVTVSGDHRFGVLDVTADPRVQVVNVSGLTIADGTGITVDGTNVGGGIYNDHADLTLSNATVAGNAVGDLGQGAGIYNHSGTLTLNSCTVADNTAGDMGQGGGIYNFTGTLLLNSSTVSGNTTGGGGAGIFSYTSVTIRSSVIADNRTGSDAGGAGLYGTGPTTITDSTISGNTSGIGATIELLGSLADQTISLISRCAIVGNNGTGVSNGAGTLTITSTTVSGNSGGGISSDGRLSVTDSIVSDNDGSGITTFDQLTLSGSTIAGNASHSFGGGLYASVGDVQVVNSTFSGNTAVLAGGGIAAGNLVTLELTSVTVTGNAANGTTEGGGGLWVSRMSQYVITRNSLIAGNVTASVGPDVSGSVLSLGYNLVGAADDSQGWGPRDRTGDSSSPLDPLLGPLQDNGGPTPTHALLAGSPAINGGDPALQLSLDQRGTVRFHNGGNPPVDIGAFDANPIHSLRLEAPPEVVAGQPFTITVTVLDGSGHTASTYLGQVHFSSTDFGAVLPDDYTFTPADGGVATFTVTLLTAGRQQLQVDTVGVIDYRAAATVNVDPPTAPAARFADLPFGNADPADLGPLALLPWRKRVRGVGR